MTGLAVGITFVVLFSFFFGSGIIPIAEPVDATMAQQKHEDWLAQTAYNLPEVNDFRARYGEVGATSHSFSDFDAAVICYTYPPIPCDPENEDKIIASLEVTMDAKGQPIKFTIYCNSNGLKGGGTGEEIDVKEFLETSAYCP